MGCVNKRRLLISFCIIIISIALLSGCKDDQSAIGNGVQKHPRDESKEDEQDSNKNNQIITPISHLSGEFGMIAGWLDDEKIVYLTHSNQSSTLYTYNLFTGKSIKLFQSEVPILSVHISPSGKRILIQSSTSPIEGSIKVIDLEGNNLVAKTIRSSELTVEWNPFNEDLVLVTAFDEQWDFTVSILDIHTKELTKSLLTKQPFAHWLTKDEFVYLDWDINSPTLFAPVVTQKTAGTKVEHHDFSNVFQLLSFQDVLLTVSVDNKNQEEAIYSFVSNRYESLRTFSIPHLTKFSDWLVPYYDFSQRKKQFITFRPLTSGEVDTYNKGFQLVRYQLDTNSEEVLLEDMENKPITLSPNGEYCLFGYQFEKIIDLDTKEITMLYEE
jgi:hypothetical protein